MYRLALALGRADVDLLEDSITDAQLKEWQQFFSLEPWGSEMEFFRTGIVAAAISNTSSNRKQGSKGASPKDFMPKFDKPRKKTQLPNAFMNDLKATFGSRNKMEAKDG